MRLFWACLVALPLFAADSVAPVAVAPQSLTFAYQFNTSIQPPTQVVTITSPQNLVVVASRPAVQQWLILPSQTGASFSATAPLTFSVDIDPRGLSPGTYTASITLQFSQGTLSVPVTLLITPAAVLLASPAFVYFDPTTGAPFQYVAVGRSDGEGFLTTSSTTAPWLTVQVASNPVLVSASPGRAGPGLSAATVQVRSSSVITAANNPLNVPVVLLGGGLTSLGPLSLSPASLTFAGAGTQTVAVSGGAFTASSDSTWLTAAVSGQTLTVTANPSGMGVGSYNATVTLISSGVLQMLPVSLTVSAAAPPNLTKIVNAASYAEGVISPGEVVALGGVNLGPAALTGLTLDAGGNVTATLSGVQVLFNGVAAPLIYVSGTQLSAVAPYDLDGQATASVQVVAGGLTSNTLTVPVTTAAPGIFTANASGIGGGAILNSDNSLNASNRPAAKGETVAVYMTGEGQTTPPGVNGKVTGTPPLPRLSVTATIDGQPAAVSFAGEAPGIVSGVMQVNVAVPANARSGDLPLVISVGGVPSQSGVTVSVR